MAQIIWGTELAAKIKIDLKAEMDKLRALNERTPGLTVILVGDDPASISYVTNKQKACREVGMKGEIITYPASVSEITLLAKIAELNQDERVDGILVQLPLPAGFDAQRITEAIAVEKDVDGLHPLNIGRLQLNQECLVPCTPSGVIEILKSIGCDLRGKRAVVIGRSNLVGRPVAQLMLQLDATVTVCHSKTPDLAAICAQADILVTAAGRPGLVTADFIKPGAVIIDVGTVRGQDGKLHGDVVFAEAEPLASYITPVPKGGGPMTVAMLLKNTLKAYEMRKKDHGIWTE
ncbi:Bifunctional protein FolD protein [bioreactor metagenome]|uniref:Bifunctional protein FolD protein n=1 Tax=bioreactor metagenome TaxID=1076179 RepID=A0A644Z5R4_9ZZZZ